MNITLLPGRVLIVPDPPETSNPKGVIIYPDVERKYASTARAYLHEPLGEEDFTGKRIIYVKWSGKPLTWKGIDFLIIKEEAVLGVIEEETDDQDAID